MTSLLCVKQPGGSVLVHDSELIDELMLDTQDHTTMMMSKGEIRKSPSPKRPQSTPVQMRRANTMDSQNLIGKTLKVQDWLNEKTVKGLQEKCDVETKEARKLYTPLLETENTFVKDIEEYLMYKDILELRKKEMLHKKWNDRVYEPLRKKILEAMDSHDWPELDRRKRELHKQYLEFVNQKGHVFLDTMDPREYYAQALTGHRPAPIKITTGAFRDPLLSQGRQRSAEDRTILRCLTGYEYTDKDIEQVKLPPLPLVPLGRHGTDSIKWLQMPLHNIESTPRMASRKRMLGIFNRGNVNFVEWSQVPVDTVMQIDKEMQLQKKRMYKETPPFRKVYFHPARQPQPPPSPPSIQEKCAESGQDINNIDSSVKIPESIGSTHVEQPPMSQPEPTHVTWPEPKPAIPELVTENTMMSVPPT